MKLTTAKIESIAAKLDQLPALEKKDREHSKQEAVRLLAKHIASLKKRGYTLEQVSEILRGEGLPIAAPTLKSYLQRGRTGKKTGVPAAPTGHPQGGFEVKPDSGDI